MRDIRILLIADSHLGFDLPARPRVERRRRGHDFLANYAAALAPALAGEVDMVVHGGDVFDRPAVSLSVAYHAFEPLRRIADAGVPVFIVPGNHERSRLPHAHIAAHPRVHIFDRPRTFAINVGGRDVALAGFPYERRAVRTRFAQILEATGWENVDAELRLLCVHHCVEGATVGRANYTFTTAADVIRARELPGEFAAVMSGHIHRRQVLTRDLKGRPLAAPVLYPGSIERTALAEIGEAKGFIVARLGADNGRVQWEFRSLPARPMIVRQLTAGDVSASRLNGLVRAAVAAAPPDAVLTIRIDGTVTAAHLRAITAGELRRFVPETMNVEIRPAGVWQSRPRPVHRHRTGPASTPGGANLQLEL